MALLLIIFCAVGGAVVGGAFDLAWASAAMVFSFAGPTADQAQGVVGIGACVGGFGSASLFAYAVIAG